MRVSDTWLVQLLRDHADQPAALALKPPGRRAHQAGVPTAEYHAQAMLRQKGADRKSRL